MSNKIGLTQLQTIQIANHQSVAMEIMSNIINQEARRNPDFTTYYKKELMDLKVYTNEIDRINNAAKLAEQPKGQ